MTSTYLAKFAEVNYLDICLAFLFSLAVGLFIFFVYKKTYRGVMYSQSFGLSLIAMTLITNVAILAVTQNVVLSLGMVGALSIVRFRSAVKEPMEIAFLFWAISAGIVIGAGLVPVALIGSVFISVVIFVLSGVKPGAVPFILVLHANDDSNEKEILSLVASGAKKYSVKSKSVNAGGVELTMELRLADGSTSTLVGALAKVNGVTDVSMVSYNGDYIA